jgi:hypothetical protein
MRSYHHIIENYQTADPEVRLNLFLDCPEFRTDFIEIENREESLKIPPAERSPFWKRFLSLVVSV